MENTLIDNIIKILSLLLPLLTGIPGVLALSKQRQKAEVRKTNAEAVVDEVEAADKIAQAALTMIKHHEEDTQRYKLTAEAYEKHMTELKNEWGGCKDQLARLATEMSKVLEENAKLVKSNTELQDKVKILEETVKILSRQLQQLGVDPNFGKRSDDSNIVKEN